MRQVRIPRGAPSDVAHAAEIVRGHLDDVLRANRRGSRRDALRECDYARILSAYRVMQAIEETREPSPFPAE